MKTKFNSNLLALLVTAALSLGSIGAFAKTEKSKQENKASSPKADAHGQALESKDSTKEAWAAIQEIQAGNKRFVEGRLNNSNQDKATREKLASGQQPPIIVLSCSDSRVPPEKVFDQGLGQIFTVRLAGHVLNAEAIASIEYAVEHLGAKALVVMGHDSCGAVKAALTTPDGKSAGSPSLDSLIAKIKPGISAFKSISPDDKTIEGPVKANVTATVKELIKKSKIVREAFELNHLLLAQGIYHLASGEVEFWSLGQPIVFMDVSKSASRGKKNRSLSSEEDEDDK